MKQCSLRVPAIVRELSNRSSSCVFSLSCSSNVQYSKLIPGIVPLVELKWCHNLILIWSLQVCFCGKPFYSATKPITSTFTM